MDSALGRRATLAPFLDPALVEPTASFTRSASRVHGYLPIHGWVRERLLAHDPHADKRHDDVERFTKRALERSDCRVWGQNRDLDVGTV